MESTHCAGCGDKLGTTSVGIMSVESDTDLLFHSYACVGAYDMAFDMGWRWQQTLASEVSLYQNGVEHFILQWVYDDVYTLWSRDSSGIFEDQTVYEFQADTADASLAKALVWVLKESTRA